MCVSGCNAAGIDRPCIAFRCGRICQCGGNRLPGPCVTRTLTCLTTGLGRRLGPLPGTEYSKHGQSLEPSLSLSPSLFLTLYHSLSISLSLSPSLALSLPLYPPHTHSPTLSLSHTHTHTDCVCKAQVSTYS